MKKIFLATIALMFVLSVAVVPALAKVERVQGPVEYGPWNATGSWVFDYNHNGGSNLHDMNLVQDENGDLTGAGGAFAGTNPYAFPWTVTEGQVSGDEITLTGDYNNLDCTFSLVGTIDDSDGSMSGTWSDDCDGNRTGSWETTTGAATRSESQFTGNHGQWVRSQENKQEAAQSRVGMPVKSLGHTEK